MKVGALRSESVLRAPTFIPGGDERCRVVHRFPRRRLPGLRLRQAGRVRYPPPLPPRLRGRPFTFADAEREGLGRDRLRRQDIERVGHGVYRWTGDPRGRRKVAGAAEGQIARGRESAPPPAAVADEHPDQEGYSWSTSLGGEDFAVLDQLLRHSGTLALSHATAARALGLWLPRRLDRATKFHVSRSRAHGTLTTERVVTHRCQVHDGDTRLITIGGRVWTVTTPERTWADLAGMLTDDELVVFADHLVNIDRRKVGADELERRQKELRRVADAPTAQNRRARLLRALERVRVGVDSPKETEVRLALVKAGLPEPDLQIQEWDPEFSPYCPAEADLGYEEAKIALHYDGDLHGRQRQIDSDVQRNAVFERKGYTNITVSGSDARNGYRRVIARVRALLDAHARREYTPRSDLE